MNNTHLLPVQIDSAARQLGADPKHPKPVADALKTLSEAESYTPPNAGNIVDNVLSAPRKDWDKTVTAWASLHAVPELLQHELTRHARWRVDTATRENLPAYIAALAPAAREHADTLNAAAEGITDLTDFQTAVETGRADQLQNARLAVDALTVYTSTMYEVGRSNSADYASGWARWAKLALIIEPSDNLKPRLYEQRGQFNTNLSPQNELDAHYSAKKLVEIARNKPDQAIFEVANGTHPGYRVAPALTVDEINTRILKWKAVDEHEVIKDAETIKRLWANAAQVTKARWA